MTPGAAPQPVVIRCEDQHLSELSRCREALGERRFAAADFPIAVGGAGSADRDGRPAGRAPRPISACTKISCSCSPPTAPRCCTTACACSSSTWLRSGDVVNLGAARLRVAEQRRRARRRSRRRQRRQHHRAADHHGERALARRERRRSGTDRCDSLSRVRSGASRGAASRFSPLRIVLAAVAVVAAVVLWFIFTATSIERAHRAGGGERARRRRAARGAARRSRAAAAGRLPRSRASCRATRRAQLQIKVTEGAESAVRAEAREAAGPSAHRRARGCAASRSTARKRGNAPGEFELPPGKHTHRDRGASAISRSAARSKSKASARRRRSSRSSCRRWGDRHGDLRACRRAVAGRTAKPRGVTPLHDGNHGGQSSDRIAARRLQAVDDRYSGEGERAAGARSGQARPAGRTPGACAPIRRARACRSPACIAVRRRSSSSCGRISRTASC